MVSTKMRCKFECIQDSRAMCSFIATDLNGDHTIQPFELRTLLWLTEGVEPTKQRVISEQKAMDINSDGTISMVEWIRYLASVDPVVTSTFEYSISLGRHTLTLV